MITELRIPIVTCTEGIYLRWYYNGWHYFLFPNGYQINMQTADQDVQVSQLFSRISKIERPTKIVADYSYRVTLEGITAGNIPGFIGLLLAEKVDQYETLWYEVDLQRGEHTIRDEGTNGWILEFEVKRKELPNTPSVYQKSIKLYIGSTLCDLNDDEVIPINKQTNDIAEMQDRQSDFTATFKIRKTRAMMLLFELSGEVGANTLFPYQKQTCKLIQDNVEMITDGTLILDRSDDEYYYVSIYSGNLDFFKTIENKKLADLTSGSPDPFSHVWNLTHIEASHTSDIDYLYPLMEPSDDGGIAQLNPGVETVNMYGGWIWPFAKIKTLWDEIFTNARFICEGNILTNDTFLKLWMPISSLNLTNTAKYLYSAFWYGTKVAVLNEQIGFSGATLINGDANYLNGFYILPYTATYKIRIIIIGGSLFTTPPALGVYRQGSYQGDMTIVGGGWLDGWIYEYSIAGLAGNHVEVLTSAFTYYHYSMSIVEIIDAKIGFTQPLNSETIFLT